jgi:hypothetical protein
MIPLWRAKGGRRGRRRKEERGERGEEGQPRDQTGIYNQRLCKRNGLVSVEERHLMSWIQVTAQEQTNNKMDRRARDLESLTSDCTREVCPWR